MREEFVTQYLWKLVRAGGVYEHKYLLGTSIARPLLAKKQVEVALAPAATRLAHGCTGKGNDQVRFELTYKALAPHLPVIAPWREWNIVSREDAIEYARAAQRAHLRNPPPRSTAATATSGTSRTKAARWKIPANAAPDDIWMLTQESRRRRPIQPGEVTIGFEKGVPVSVNGKRMTAVELLEDAEPHRRRARHRPHRPGGEPLRGHEVARLL